MVLSIAVLAPALGVRAMNDVTSDPESLRFQYPLDEAASSRASPGKKTTPTVYREQDRFLPINNVSRVMRHAIPRTGKVRQGKAGLEGIIVVYHYVLLLFFLFVCLGVKGCKGMHAGMCVRVHQFHHQRVSNKKNSSFNNNNNNKHHY